MPSRAAVPCRVVLLLAAALCLGSAILLNEFTLAWLDFRTSPPPGTERAIRIRQLWLLGAAVLLAGVAWRVRFVVPGAWARIALVCVALLGPLATLEFGLRPVSALHRKPTTIFVRDDVLGWRLRPGVEDDWAGVRIQVNAKGLRGPEVPYARTPGALRILYLGDSVTFGFRLRDAREAYPYVVARHLEAAVGVQDLDQRRREDHARGHGHATGAGHLGDVEEALPSRAGWVKTITTAAPPVVACPRPHRTIRARQKAPHAKPRAESNTTFH